MLRGLLQVLLLIAAALLRTGNVAAFSCDGRVAQYLNTISLDLPTKSRETLLLIPDEGRRLLATRAYLRNRDSLAERWSWSADEIAAYQRSDEHRTALAEIAGITARFEQLNPGYTLYVNSQVRSLNTQIERWNENPTVGRAASQLSHAARGECSNNAYRHLGAQAAVRFAAFLQSWRPAANPTLAAPGLSRHGQGRAFDFQIQQGSALIAGTDTASIGRWDQAGWTQKLNDAVTSASARFSGPLRSPREPWHYEYRP